jgi:hypothetical protein
MRSDLSSLPTSYRDYGPDEFLRRAAVARHAIANGHHMYCVWPPSVKGNAGTGWRTNGLCGR